MKEPRIARSIVSTKVAATKYTIGVDGKPVKETILANINGKLGENEAVAALKEEHSDAIIKDVTVESSKKLYSMPLSVFIANSDVVTDVPEEKPVLESAAE